MTDTMAQKLRPKASPAVSGKDAPTDSEKSNTKHMEAESKGSTVASGGSKDPVPLEYEDTEKGPVEDDEDVAAV